MCLPDKKELWLSLHYFEDWDVTGFQWLREKKPPWTLRLNRHVWEGHRAGQCSAEWQQTPSSPTSFDMFQFINLRLLKVLGAAFNSKTLFTLEGITKGLSAGSDKAQDKWRATKLHMHTPLGNYLCHLRAILEGIASPRLRFLMWLQKTLGLVKMSLSTCEM